MSQYIIGKHIFRKEIERKIDHKCKEMELEIELRKLQEKKVIYITYIHNMHNLWNTDQDHEINGKEGWVS